MKLSVIEVILWTFGIRLTLLVSLPIVAALAPGIATDLVIQAALLAIFYLGACALFAARRPGRTWSETFALRPTSPWLAVVALLIGVAACLPASVLAGWVEHFFPIGEAEQAARDELMTPRSFAHGVAIFIFAAGVGPFAEELLFRGALYTGLRPSHSPAYAGWTTGVLFTLGHEPRFWPAILALSGLLAAVRAISGSLWPSLFLHVGFNATALGMPDSHPLLKDPSVVLVAGSLLLALSLTGVIVWIGRSSASAESARKVDLVPDPGLGETPL
jgi:membrane protease YdiL (CAAX protease family)